jgi:hypothetical protein
MGIMKKKHDTVKNSISNDLDGDGYSTLVDSDESDPNINPGATAVPDKTLDYALVSFTLNPDTVRSGTPVITGAVTGEIGLDRPAPAGGVQVDISGGASVPQGAVVVAEGQMMGRFTLDGMFPLLFPVGTFFGLSGVAAEMVFEARLGEVTKTAVLHVVNEYMLKVTTSGDGTGTVTSSPGAIQCRGNPVAPGTGICAEHFLPGQSVQLTATPDSGSTFAGWGGDASSRCAGTGPCILTIGSDSTVDARFTLTK